MADFLASQLIVATDGVAYPDVAGVAALSVLELAAVSRFTKPPRGRPVRGRV
jgi:hypothetical protein